MRTTTTRAQRAHALTHYGRDDFDTFWDWFLFLHLHPGTQAFHAMSMVLGWAMCPWAFVQSWSTLSPWPLVLFTAVYYGTGFASHWIFDGLISPTVPSAWQAYKAVFRMNVAWWLGTLPDLERELVARYPFVRDVYQPGERGSAAKQPGEPAAATP